MNIHPCIDLPAADKQPLWVIRHLYGIRKNCLGRKRVVLS